MGECNTIQVPIQNIGLRRVLHSPIEMLSWPRLEDTRPYKFPNFIDSTLDRKQTFSGWLHKIVYFLPHDKFSD